MNPLESIDSCITCSICTINCPVIAATKKFKGPKLTGPSAERFRLKQQKEIEGLSYCSNCKCCDISCPSNVKISSLNMLARAEYYRTRRPPFRDWLLAHAPFLAKLIKWIPYQLQLIGMKNSITRWLLDKIGIDRRASIPFFAPTYFPKLYSKYKKKQKGHYTKKVVFFPGCYINYYEPQTGMDFVAIMEKANYEVILPKVRCCNLPLISNGYYSEGKKVAHHNSKILQQYAEQNIPIVTMCPSCALTLKQEYAELFPEMIDQVTSFSRNIEDACEFIIKLIESKELQINVTLHSTKLLYHTACHLKAQGIGKPGFELLQRLPGASIEDAEAGCCGISGSYGFKKDKYDIATSIGNNLFDIIKKSGALFTLSECGTCRLQMYHHTGVEALHPLTLLHRILKQTPQ